MGPQMKGPRKIPFLFLRLFQALRYKPLDSCHDARRALQNATDCDGGVSNLEDLILRGKHAFAKQVEYSIRFQRIWHDVHEKWKARMGDFHSWEGVVDGWVRFNYKQCRYDSDCIPTTLFFRTLLPVLEVFAISSQDTTTTAAREQSKRSTETLEKLSGDQGTEDMLTWALVNEMGACVHVFVRKEDAKFPDVAKVCRGMEACLARLKLITKGGFIKA